MRDPSIFGTTRAYFDQRLAALAETLSPEELTRAMMAGNEDKAMKEVLESSVAAVYPG